MKKLYQSIHCVVMSKFVEKNNKKKNVHQPTLFKNLHLLYSFNSKGYTRPWFSYYSKWDI